MKKSGLNFPVINGFRGVPACKPRSEARAMKRESSYLSLFDIQETGSHYLISFDLPNVLGDKVEVRLSGDELVLVGKGGMGERFRDPVVSLHMESREQVVTARYEDGLLVLALPKEAVGRRRIG